jgi:hypothetical protein
VGNAAFVAETMPTCTAKQTRVSPPQPRKSRCTGDVTRCVVGALSGCRDPDADPQHRLASRHARTKQPTPTQSAFNAKMSTLHH